LVSLIEGKKVMPHRIFAADDASYVILEEVGDITRQSQLQHNQEAHEFARKIGTRKFLVDVTNARNRDSIGENYQFAYTDLENLRNTNAIERGERVAILASPGDDSHDFAVTVMVNSGSDVKLFNDRDSAIDFLKRG
jgi:hypothetical protein